MLFFLGDNKLMWRSEYLILKYKGMDPSIIPHLGPCKEMLQLIGTNKSIVKNVFLQYFPEYSSRDISDLTYSNFQYECYKKSMSVRIHERISKYIPEEILNALQTSACVIAGGYISSALYLDDEQFEHHKELIDIDVYNTRDGIIDFFKKIIEHNSSVDDDEDKSRYKVRSSREKIKFIYSGIGSDQNIQFHIPISLRINESILKFDFVIVDDPIIAIQNFDFTFIQVGAHYSHNNKTWNLILPKNVFVDVANKKGSLIPAFQKEYEKGNAITHNRVRKYQMRGFEVTFPKMTVKPINYNQFNKNRTLKVGVKFIRILIYLFMASNPRWLDKKFLNNSSNIYWLLQNFSETLEFLNSLKSYISQFYEILSEDASESYITILRDIIEDCPVSQDEFDAIVSLDEFNKMYKNYWSQPWQIFPQQDLESQQFLP